MTNNVADLLYTEPEETVTDMTEEEYEASLPHPTGYRVLIALPVQEETHTGGVIIKAKETQHIEHLMSIVGLVVELGPDCYKDKNKFPVGPWCETGNYVMFRSNSGTRFKFGGMEYRLMNDDSIEAVVADPKMITRV